MKREAARARRHRFSGSDAFEDSVEDAPPRQRGARSAAAEDVVMTLQEVAAELGVTREYVGQIERAALKKVRAYLEASGLKGDMFDWT